jgi:hypothetical protein
MVAASDSGASHPPCALLPGAHAHIVRDGSVGAWRGSPWPRLLLGFTFGVLGPVLASWFVVAPLKGIPIAAGWVPQRMLASILINGCWGIGLVLLYAGLRRWVAGPRQARAR